MSIPTDLMAEAGMVGAEQDAMMEQMQQQITPQGKFSKNSLNRLVKELNVVLEMFDQTYPMFEEDITIFPQEFVSSLTMVKSAADDAGVDFDIDMEEISDDRDLAMVAGQLRKLGRDKTFKRFLEANTMMPEEEEVEVEIEVEAGDDTDMDEFFAGRM
jgi:hypothetical protein|tara:strand:+ start:561 stop:1034 length:474 start_codon:yes stop_codon:yes gene_type:complete